MKGPRSDGKQGSHAFGFGARAGMIVVGMAIDGMFGTVISGAGWAGVGRFVVPFQFCQCGNRW